LLNHASFQEVRLKRARQYITLEQIEQVLALDVCIYVCVPTAKIFHLEKKTREKTCINSKRQSIYYLIVSTNTEVFESEQKIVNCYKTKTFN
jgi:hypothetical protein